MALIAMLNIDLWIFIVSARFLRKLSRLLKPIFDAIFIMSIGAALLLAYCMVQMPDNHEFIYSKSKIPSEQAMTIADNKDSYKYLIERELMRLKNKALSLERSLKMMVNNNNFFFFSNNQFKLGC